MLNMPTLPPLGFVQKLSHLRQRDSRERLFMPEKLRPDNEMLSEARKILVIRGPKTEQFCLKQQEICSSCILIG